MGKKVIIITITFIVLAFAGGLSYVFLKKSQDNFAVLESPSLSPVRGKPNDHQPVINQKPISPPPESPPLPVHERRPTSSTVDTSDWKTYYNEEYGFELKYPHWALLCSFNEWPAFKAVDFDISLDSNCQTNNKSLAIISVRIGWSYDNWSDWVTTWGRTQFKNKEVVNYGGDYPQGGPFQETMMIVLGDEKNRIKKILELSANIRNHEEYEKTIYKSIWETILTSLTFKRGE